MEPIWFRAYAPRTVLDAANTLAEHVDVWEEDRIPCLWHTRPLTEFMEQASFADIRQAPRFRQLLADYVNLGLETARTQQGDDPYTRERKQNVRESIAQVKRWLGEPFEQTLPRVGVKREREGEYLQDDV